MATRNRTALYRKYRDALHQVKTTTTTLSTGGRRGPVIELATASLLNPYSQLSTNDTDNPSGQVVTVGLPPAWVDLSEEIGSSMQRARTKMAELAKAHAKVLMPSFGDAKEDQHAIEVLSQEITELLKKCEKNLQQLSGHGASDDTNVRKNVQRFLATDLQSLSMEFRKRQTVYLKRIRQQQDGTDGVDIEMNFNQKRLKQEDDSFDSDFNDQQMTKLKKNEALTDERQREILQIVDSVSDLAEIMKDLSTLVIDQGTIVDRIDYNIQNVSASVQQGLKHLETAERSQRNGGMVMCATVLIFMCLFMIVVLIIKETFF
ncbi:tlg2p-like protein a isoform X1 [Cryptomeria japonica]|uniref:tlg2p-like protein a isoform X1 n=2 Tax=Cryptomeria japonica TaxID=3369 RepID=UPI0027DAB3B5|nr:tlg2p-like protein a isoform X1 [Cryptomeria japonica]